MKVPKAGKKCWQVEDVGVGKDWEVQVEKFEKLRGVRVTLHPIEINNKSLIGWY